jgi:hypothetical protein
MALKPTKKEQEIIALFREIERLMPGTRLKLVCGEACMLLRARPDTGDVIAPSGEEFAGRIDQSRIVETFEIWSDGGGC